MALARKCYPLESVCLRFTSCGVEYQFWGGAHFSGNFFWANCAHVSRLPPLWDPLDNAWDAEFFLFKVSKFADEVQFGKVCGFNPFHCGVNHYDNRCPRSQYRPILQDLVKNEVLPGSKPPSTCNEQGIRLEFNSPK